MMIYILLEIISQKEAKLSLKVQSRLVEERILTISQGFDTLLITAIDNILLKNRISKLSVESLIVSGQMGPGASSFMVAGAVSSAIGS